MLGIAPLGGHPLGGFAFLSSGYVLTADPGSYALTGAAAGVKAGRVLSAANNRILNGHFSIDTANWTVQGSDTTFVSAGQQGELALGPSASDGFAYQAVTVVPGRRYTLSAFLKPSGYYLSADPGSYALTGADATLTPAGGGGGYGAIPDESFSDSGVGARGVGITIKDDGGVYKTSTLGETLHDVWVPPFDAAFYYRIRATHISGATGSGTFGSWLYFTVPFSQHNWSLTESSIGTLSTTILLELERDNGAGYVPVDTATITLTATRTS
jgi:hypothetical protein